MLKVPPKPDTVERDLRTVCDRILAARACITAAHHSPGEARSAHTYADMLDQDQASPIGQHDGHA
jgi:hypothetical protein